MRTNLVDPCEGQGSSGGSQMCEKCINVGKQGFFRYKGQPFTYVKTLVSLLMSVGMARVVKVKLILCTCHACEQ